MTIAQDQKIDALEKRLVRLEAFITKKQTGWSTLDGMLQDGSLHQEIKDTVGGEFRVDATIRLLKNNEHLSDWS